MTNDTLPRRQGEPFADYIMRWMIDAEQRRIRELDQRVEAGRIADVNTYAIEG